MSYALIRAALRTRIAAVSGVGNVHALIRHTAHNPTTSPFKSMFVTDGKLNTWHLTRRSREDILCEGNSSVYRVRHTIEIEALYALNDQDSSTVGSETVFQDLLDAVIADLRNGDRTLGGNCVTHSHPELGVVEHVEFYGVLSHRGLIRLVVEEVA